MHSIENNWISVECTVTEFMGATGFYNPSDEFIEAIVVQYTIDEQIINSTISGDLMINTQVCGFIQFQND